MRIAIISPWAISNSAIGGTERFVIDLANNLMSSGHEVVVFMLSGSSQEIDGIEYRSLNILGNDEIANEYNLKKVMGDFAYKTSFENIAKRVESLVDMSDFDTLHINSLLFLRAWKTKRRIFTIHTNPFEYRQAWGKSSYLKTIEILKKEVKNNKNIILTTPSRHYALVFQELINSPVHFIPHAINTERIIFSGERIKLLDRYGLSDSRITFLLPSRLEPVQKRPQVLFNAIANLPQDKINSLQIISSGLDDHYTEHRNRLESFAEQYNIKATFIYFKRMAEAYALANVVVLPSRSESFGYSALESLSLGKLTLLNTLPTFKEIGEGNSNAHFFKDEQTLTDLISRIIEKRIAPIKVSDVWKHRYDMKEWCSKYEAIL